MISILFFLKFKAQLRRTRPDLIRQIDEILKRSVQDAGGKISGNRSIITADFDAESMGFWLEIYILIEKIKQVIDASNEFFGYSFVICGKTYDNAELLCRNLAKGGGGVFFDSLSSKKFSPYAALESYAEWRSENKEKKDKYGLENFLRVKELKIFRNLSGDDSDSEDEIIDILEKENEENVLLLGKSLTGIRKGVFAYCEKINKDFPLLKICFGSMGLGALVDAWSFNIRSLATKEDETIVEEIESLWELLFRERIRNEISDYTVRCVKRYLSILFEFYSAAAKRNKCLPFLLIENIHFAGKKTANLLLDTITEVNKKNMQKITAFGIAEDDILPEKIKQWRDVFSVVRKPETCAYRSAYLPNLTSDLLEIIYTISLMERFFSPELFLKIFEEDGINPVMVNRAFSILNALGVIDNPREPRLLNRSLEERAGEMLEEKAPGVRKLICRRLLHWAERRNFSHCFRLLEIIAGLKAIDTEEKKQGGHFDDDFILKCISSDIVNQTVLGIETAIGNEQLAQIIPAEKVPVICHIYKTSKALYSGNIEEIESVYANQSEGFKNLTQDISPVFKAQIITNLCGYHLGKYDINEAMKKAKEAILLCQRKNNFCLPRVYRLFALVSLLKQQTTETIEYLNFALKNAENSGNNYETGICAYYAAAVMFIYGDIYNALRLTQKSAEQSLLAGCADWADRARFLEGRLNFELGNYQKAYDIFSLIRNKPHGNFLPEKTALLDAWIYRCEIYFKSPRTPKPESDCQDVLLFEIEAAYLSAQYEKAVSISSSNKQERKEKTSKEKYLHTESPNWESGFSQCEYLYFPHGEINDRINCLFTSLAKSHIKTEREEAMNDIQQLLRDERLDEMDPYGAVYFYAKYCIIKQTNGSIVDMSTAVSMAFKRLQRRASRIEDVGTRSHYLNGSRWNRELTVVAREFKLI